MEGDVLLITKVAKVNWNGANKKRYVELGYEFTCNGDTFSVDVAHLSKGSHSLVEIECDYCGKVIERKYKDYIGRSKTNVIKKDCCGDCQTIKSREGVIKKYGHKPEDFLTSKSSREKSKATLLERYGVENPSQVPEFLEKMLKTREERYGKEYFSELMSGSNNPNWKGGVKEENELARTSYKYKEWREGVFKSHDYTCYCCDVRGGYIEAHHIKGFAEFPDLRYKEDNGVPLCLECHKKFHNLYGNFQFNQDDLNEFINDHEKV